MRLGVLGESRGLGPSCTHPGRRLGASWQPLAPLWVRLGCILRRLGYVLGRQGHVSGSLGNGLGGVLGILEGPGALGAMGCHGVPRGNLSPKPDALCAEAR